MSDLSALLFRRLSYLLIKILSQSRGHATCPGPESVTRAVKHSDQRPKLGSPSELGLPVDLLL